jgi:hypothetical protein
MARKEWRPCLLASTLPVAASTATEKIRTRDNAAHEIGGKGQANIVDIQLPHRRPDERWNARPVPYVPRRAISRFGSHLVYKDVRFVARGCRLCPRGKLVR